MLVVWERGLRTNPKIKVDVIAWWIDSGATTHVCKDRCWFKTYEPVEDGSILYMGNDHFAPVHRKRSVVLEFSSEKSITLFNVLYVPKLRFGYYNNGIFMLNLNKVPCDFGFVYMPSFTVINTSLWHARLGHVQYIRMLEMSKDDLIPAIDENTGKCNTCNKKYVITFIDDASMFCYVYLLHAKDEALDKFRISKTEVELQPNDLIKTLQLEVVNIMILYFSNLAVVRLPDPKRKTLGEKGIDCIFVGYDEHSTAYRFYFIEPNDSVSINSIIESRDAIFDENCFSSIPRPKDIIPNSDESQRDDHSNDVPSETLKPRREAIDDEIRSIMENNTWVLSDLPLSCKPLGCKWIFKRKMKVDGTIDKSEARLVIQGFRQKEGIDYFDTYAPVARITTIRLSLALAAIRNSEPNRSVLHLIRT
ncbi:zinc finger, CCHC-type containing protein [Tanacetum coccineum]